MKKTNSKRVSDTVFFKHKYIMQPILTSVDILTKAIGDLTHTLKGRRNTKGIMELEALQKLDELLNQAPQAQTPPPRQVPRKEATTPRVANPVDKPTPRMINPVNTPTPKVDATIPHKRQKKCHKREPKCTTLYAQQQTAEQEYPKDIK